MMKVAIYCGSASGEDVSYQQQTTALGTFLAKQGFDLVYGGGDVGLMGTIADAFLASGANAYGVMPEHLAEKELAHKGLTELTVVADMHERKAAMADMADAFIALPGGAGTLEEIFEVWTWAQLGLHKKPCAFFNINNYYEPLFRMIEQMVSAGFTKPIYEQMLIKTNDAQTLVTELKAYQPPTIKWS